MEIEIHDKPEHPEHPDHPTAPPLDPGKPEPDPQPQDGEPGGGVPEDPGKNPDHP